MSFSWSSLRAWILLLILPCIGAVFVGAFAPFYFESFGLLFPLTLLLVGAQGSTRRALWHVWLMALGFFVAGVYWIYFSMHVYNGLDAWLVYAMIVVLSAYLALFPALSVWILRRYISLQPLGVLLAFPALWVLLEWLRSWLFTGFPWLVLGYSQSNSFVGQSAAVLGVYAVSGLLAFFAAVFYWLFRESPPRWVWSALIAVALLGMLTPPYVVGGIGLAALVYHAFRRAPVAWVALGVVGLVVVAALPRWGYDLPSRIRVALVQGNIPQEIKYTKPELSYARYLELTSPLKDVDLVVWPETSFPNFLHRVENEILAPLDRELQAKNIELILGIQVQEKLSETEQVGYNAALRLSERQRRYYKVHLVPFGEYMPWHSLLADVYKAVGAPDSHFSSGPPVQPLLRYKTHPVGVGICYEIAFGNEMRGQLPQAEFLINLTNNAWFFDPRMLRANRTSGQRPLTLAEERSFNLSSLSLWYTQFWEDSTEPYQLLQMAQMRAIESARYVLTATNDGVSAVINPRGEVIATLPRFVKGVVRAEIIPRSGSTPYVFWGNYLIISLCVILLAGVWLRQRRLR